MNPRDSLIRWRLVLGSDAERGLGCGLEGLEAQRDQALGFLYNREYGSRRNVRQQSPADRHGGQEDSQPNVPEWINAVHTLFPRRTIERIEKDALERYQIQELVTNPDLLARAQPSQTLLKAILHTKHLMNQEVLAMARTLVRKVIEQLLEKLARPVRSVFLGAADRRRRSHMKVAKNFDARTTLRRNLANYDPQSKRLFIRTPYFYSRVRRQTDRWQVIVVVDESGSMVDSVIHAAVTASIFVGIKSLRTHLILFDTNVVDVTDELRRSGGGDHESAARRRHRHRRRAGVCLAIGGQSAADDRCTHHGFLRGRSDRTLVFRDETSDRKRGDPTGPGGAGRTRRTEL